MSAMRPRSLREPAHARRSETRSLSPHSDRQTSRTRLATMATMSLSRRVAARAFRTVAQVRPAQIPVRFDANSAKFTVKQLPTPCIKLAAADLVPLNRARHRGTRRESFANDRELLLHRPVAPSRNAPDNLNTRLRTTHTTSRMTARIRITLADHFALQTWNAQTAQSAQTMQGGLQTTLTKNPSKHARSIPVARARGLHRRRRPAGLRRVRLNRGG